MFYSLILWSFSEPLSLGYYLHKYISAPTHFDEIGRLEGAVQYFPSPTWKSGPEYFPFPSLLDSVKNPGRLL